MGTAARPVAARPAGRTRALALRGALILAALLVVAYLGISAYAAGVVTRPQRDPIGATPALVGMAFTDVRFPAAGGDAEIAGWYVAAENADRAVVLVHGKDSSRSTEFGGGFVELAARLHDRGFAILMIDMRGHGDSSDARFTFGLQERRDIIGAVDWLETQGFSPGRIGVLGVSMGAASAIGAMADDPQIGALVSDCSYADITPLLQQHWGAASGLPDIFLPSTLLMGRLIYGIDVASARPIDEIDDIQPRPLLIIHGAADGFTSVEHGRQLAEAAPAAEYWEVPGALHAGSFQADEDAYVERVAGFFERNLR